MEKFESKDKLKEYLLSDKEDVDRRLQNAKQHYSELEGKKDALSYYSSSDYFKIFKLKSRSSIMEGLFLHLPEFV